MGAAAWNLKAFTATEIGTRNGMFYQGSDDLVMRVTCHQEEGVDEQWPGDWNKARGGCRWHLLTNRTTEKEKEYYEIMTRDRRATL